MMGGWMKSMADSLIQIDGNIKIAIASPWPTSKDLIDIKEGNYQFYGLPVKANNPDIDHSIIPYWKKINATFKPDLVHLHGTEFTHGYGWILANGNHNVVVSLQGLVSVISRYETGGINFRFIRDMTLRDMLTLNLLSTQNNRLKKSAINEIKLLKSIDHVIGRTEWDKTHVWSHNQDCKYHFCNENLRNPFYLGEKWSPNTCIPHRIFLSQAASSIKGIHKVIEALPLILRKYPDTMVYVAGHDFTIKNTFIDKLRYNKFAKYIDRLMNNLGVREHIHFTGMLNADEMAEQYRKANVFICPSSIENSPNSLGEAQLIGVPVIASYVGGIPDMVTHGLTGLLYRFEEHEMLAQFVCRVFDDDTLAIHLSENGRVAAEKRHDRNTNASRTIEIYNKILQLSEK